MTAKRSQWLFEFNVSCLADVLHARSWERPFDVVSVSTTCKEPADRVFPPAAATACVTGYGRKVWMRRSSCWHNDKIRRRDSRAAVAHLLCRRLIGLAVSGSFVGLMLASTDRQSRSREELAGEMLVIRPSAPARNVHERVERPAAMARCAGTSSPIWRRAASVT